MKKLKNKVFLVLFGILSLFLFTILFIFNYQDYNREKNEIKNNLIRLDNDFSRQNNKSDIKILEKEPKIFMDIVLYTVVLDGNDNILEVISHTDEKIDMEKIYSVAQNIIENKNKGSNKIGNLYFTRYSYSFKRNSTLIIIDNMKIREKLFSKLKTSLIIFILLEIIIIYVAVKLTKWITRPVIESFEKQKQFVADASHELKTPLSVIMASTDALLSNFNDKKWLENIKSESERMNILITNLLNLAKIENGIDKCEYSISNLSKIVEMSVLTFEGIIYENKIKLEYSIEENLEFSCDVNQIKQLMGILIDNAVKHSFEAGEISIILKKEKNEYIIVVKNKGEAIEKQDEDRIFERFYRGDKSRNRNDNRYGLGLAIAKSIVINHGGTISASSSNGYTSFIVRFKQK